MRAGGGAQSEVVVSLAIIMVTATTLLTAFFLRTHALQVESMQVLLGRALLAEARAPTFSVGLVSEGVDWWTISKAGVVRPIGAIVSDIDPESIELAEEVLERGTPVLRSGAPWQAVRFAVALSEDGPVAVARLPSVVSRASLVTLLLVDSLVFVAFGSYLLRRRVVRPMHELAAAARSIGESGPGGRVIVEGVDEVQQVARAFNEMSEALEQRTGALEKAVGELRETNAQLHRARAGLARAERLAAVGSLAAGVAHEVGNPMGALLAYLQLAQRDEGLGEEGRSHLCRAAEQGGRVREILRQLLDFSRPPQARRAMVDLVRVGEQIEALVRAQRRYESIAFELRHDRGDVLVHSDESMLSQILLNLVINAADAVRDIEAPRIRMTLRPAQLRTREGDAAGPAERREGFDSVECEVEDNGPGVAEEDRERIFDPFFTTKQPGEGTGLGLANSLRLTEELGGLLEHRPSPDLGGAAFVVRIPVSDGDPRKLGIRAQDALSP
jgi:C4-dicarboxylate-specific signal transduction histidine kinase